MTSEEIEERLSALEQAILNRDDANDFVDNTLDDVRYVPVLDGGGVGGSSVAGVFEPVFGDDGTLANVGNGYFPYGRKFMTAVNVADSAKVKKGMIGLKVVHGSSYGPSEPTSAEIVLVGQSMVSILNESLTETVIPLYFIEDGAIAIDCRSVMSMPVRE